MKIYIASDHRGFKMKEKVIRFLYNNGIVPIDLGTKNDKSCDYNDFANKLCSKVVADPENRGILICGSGVGMSIAANRNKGIRCVNATKNSVIKVSRQHNDANVIAIGAMFNSLIKAEVLITTFLTTPFLGGHYKLRNDKLDK